MGPFSRSKFNCVLFATCVRLYLLQIQKLICTRSLESIMRTGLTSYVSHTKRSQISSAAHISIGYSALRAKRSPNLQERNHSVILASEN